MFLVTFLTHTINYADRYFYLELFAYLARISGMSLYYLTNFESFCLQAGNSAIFNEFTIPKGGFFSERADAFVISSNRQT